MNAEHSAALVQLAPHVYADYGKGPRESLMGLGFDCGDGWFNVLKELSVALEALPADERPRATQVKEKFGTLRFYTSHGSDRIWELIGEAERQSATTCEQCGKPGDQRSDGGWWSVSCEDCAK